MFKIQIRSRHQTHNILREKDVLPKLPFKSVIRFGSSTEFNDGRIELNTVQAIKNSANKLLMKQCFTDNNVKTADWWCINQNQNIGKQFTFCNFDNNDRDCSIEELPYPIISKHKFGSRGTGNKKHDTVESLQQWMQNKNLDNYIFEKFYNYVREYRLHITKDGCFYSCRKMLKENTPADKKWFRNDQHCIWALENNANFDKPVNWEEIVQEGIKALNAVGLDFGAIDLRIQSSKDKKGNVRKNPEFVIIEINSAPSFGEITKQKYIEVLPKLLTDKYNGK